MTVKRKELLEKNNPASVKRMLEKVLGGDEKIGFKPVPFPYLKERGMIYDPPRAVVPYLDRIGAHAGACVVVYAHNSNTTPIVFAANGEKMLNRLLELRFAGSISKEFRFSYRSKKSGFPDAQPLTGTADELVIYDKSFDFTRTYSDFIFHKLSRLNDDGGLGPARLSRENGGVLIEVDFRRLRGWSKRKRTDAQAASDGLLERMRNPRPELVDYFLDIIDDPNYGEKLNALGFESIRRASNTRSDREALREVPDILQYSILIPPCRVFVDRELAGFVKDGPGFVKLLREMADSVATRPGLKGADIAHQTSANAVYINSPGWREQAKKRVRPRQGE
ncbi:Uncharacterised protein [uncultured archaeon]|nr:Uncharacterised protein [uncultured archaeon]